MSGNAHTIEDLRQMQALPLEAKIIMTKQRIKAWYDAWTRFEIFDEKTGKTRFITFDTREQKEPPMNETEFVVSAVPGWVYVSVSGKDSSVLKHIIDSMYSDVPALFVNTGLEYPELQQFWKDVQKGKYPCFNSHVEIIRPEMRFDEVIKAYGYPVISKELSMKIFDARVQAKRNNLDVRQTRLYDRDFNPNSERCLHYPSYCMAKYDHLFDAKFNISHKCCYAMKKKPAKQYEKNTGRKPFIGTLTDESRLRRTNWLQHGCNAFNSKRPTSQPLSFWTEQDVLHYIQKYNVPYPSVYGDIVIDFNDGEPEEQMNIVDLLGDYEPGDKLKTTGCDRTGCIFCTFGITQDGCPNRFQRLKQTHPRQYEYCIGGGEYVWEGTAYTSSGEPRKIPWINDDGSPMTNEEIEAFVNENNDNENFKFVRKWQPNKEGLGLGKVLDYIGVKYD